MNLVRMLKEITESAEEPSQYDCMIPNAQGRHCGEDCCGSHSIQRAVLDERMGKPFSKQSDVINFKPNPIIGYFARENIGRWPPKRPTSDASKIPFACGNEAANHDSQVFNLIEGKQGANALQEARIEGQDKYKKELFLFAYRACLSYLRLLDVSGIWLEEYLKRLHLGYWPRKDKRHKLSNKAKWIQFCKQQKLRIPYLLEDLDVRKNNEHIIQVKSEMDSIYVEERYEDLVHEFTQFRSPVRIATASFYGNSLLTVLPDSPSSDWHTACFSAPRLFANTNLEEKRDKIANMDWLDLLQDILVESPLNTYLSMNYYDNNLVSNEFRDSVRDTIFTQ